MLLNSVPTTLLPEQFLPSLVAKQLSMKDYMLSISQRTQMLLTHHQHGVFHERLIKRWLRSRLADSLHDSQRMSPISWSDSWDEVNSIGESLQVRAQTLLDFTSFVSLAAEVIYHDTSSNIFFIVSRWESQTTTLWLSLLALLCCLISPCPYGYMSRCYTLLSFWDSQKTSKSSGRR